MLQNLTLKVFRFDFKETVIRKKTLTFEGVDIQFVKVSCQKEFVKVSGI